MENKKAEIHHINIERAENGFIYRVCVEDHQDKMSVMKDHEYVYDSVEDVLEAVKDDLESPHAREYPSKEKVKAAFHEVNEDEPEVVGETRKNKGKEAARKQLTAIALSKARGGLFKK